MSDLTQAISRLELAVRNHTLSVDLLSLRVSQIESQLQSADSWELIEPSEEGFGGLENRSVVLEEGPPLPPALEVFAGVLSETGGGRRARARAAFEAGFWAQIALETHTETYCLHTSHKFRSLFFPLDCAERCRFVHSL